MFASTPSPESGQRLRAERLRVRLSTRDVERLSQAIAREKGNQEYYISHAWLTEIEHGKFKPNIYKLYSLSVVYKRAYHEILALFDIYIRDIGREQITVGLPHTHLVNSATDGDEVAIRAPLELRQTVQLEKTNLVSQMFARWGEVPVELLQRMNLQNSLYGYIGINDYTLYPMIRPGSFVQIDARQRKLSAGTWKNEFDRPIYFVELRDEYVCSWCELRGKSLLLIPSPQSREPVRQFRFPMDAEIVGRVTAVTMNITEVAK
jgi:transcriptional regulator with XRE-family HTH domain